MIKLKDKHNWYNTPVGLSFLLCSTTVHSLFLWYTTAVKSQELPVSPYLGKYEGGKGCGGVMFLIHPFPNWKSLF